VAIDSFQFHTPTVMGRTPCCDGKGVKKGPWTPEEDKLLVDFVQANGSGNWRLLPKLAGKFSSPMARRVK
jgi:hypothetical protein